MKQVEDGVLVFRPDYEPEEIIEFPDWAPRRYQILYRGEPNDPVRQWPGSAGSKLFVRAGTILMPLWSEGEDPNTGAFRYIYRMKPDGRPEYWARQS